MMTTSLSNAKASVAGVANPGTFMTLNGLRGLAAFCVMTYHRPEWFYPHFLFTDAYLAVDFFFMLSGFVLARAYLARLGKSLSFAKFVSRRLQRLYPLTVLAALLGALVFFIDHRGRVPMVLWIDTAATMFTLPTPWGAGSWRLDPPMWSLFYEILVNIAFGLVVATFGGARMMIYTLILGVAFLIIYPLEYAEFRPQGVEFLGHIVRVSFLFFMGVLLEILHTRGFLKRFRLGVALGGGLLIASFMIHDGTPLGSLLRLAAVVVLYPLIIMGAANHEPKGLLRRVASFSGDISYPLYLLHFPFLAMIAGAALVLHHPKQPTSFAEALARFAIVVVLSWLAFRFYDEPVRAQLAKWLNRSRSPATSPASEPDTARAN
jgi:peptidoglycan/LPS O-acetylase OafA/YrhL